MELEIGKAYFEISWANHKTRIPDIETYIYIGHDIFGESPGEYFFQTSYSYETHGNFAEQKDQKKKAEAQIVLMRADMVEILYTINELIDHLNALKEKHGGQFGSISRDSTEGSS